MQIPHHPKKGFTLVEILIVLSIFVIIMTLITLSVSLFGKGTLALDRLANQMYAQILVIQEKSWIQQQVYRLQKTSSGYAFSRYDLVTHDWRLLESPKRLKPTKIADEMDVVMTDERNNLIDSIIFFPGGDFSPFKIQIHNAKNESRMIQALPDGQIVLLESVAS